MCFTPAQEQIFDCCVVFCSCINLESVLIACEPTQRIRCCPNTESILAAVLLDSANEMAQAASVRLFAQFDVVVLSLSLRIHANGSINDAVLIRRPWTSCSR